MQRLRIALLVGLLLVSSSRAQPPAEEMELPKPTRVIPHATETTTVSGSEVVSSSTILEAMPPTNDWRFWVSADYALAFINGKSLPSLATTSPPGTPMAAAGIPGAATTQVLIGSTHIPNAARSLGKLDFGAWIDQEHKFGVASGFFITENKGNSFNASSRWQHDPSSSLHRCHHQSAHIRAGGFSGCQFRFGPRLSGK